MAVKVRLKEIRKSRQISQNKLARLLEMSLANVQKIEYGKAKAIPFETLDKLCRVLSCEVGELIVFVPDEGELINQSSEPSLTEHSRAAKHSSGENNTTQKSCAWVAA